MAESSLSNLLKNNRDRATSFGFPLIRSQPEEPQSVAAPEDQPPEPEPEVTAEEMYRRKLLEIERKTQEIERDAYARGFAQGEKDGLDYGQKSIQVVGSQIERLAQNMKSLPEKVLEDYRDWLIRTSIGVARQIVNREIRTEPGIVADLVRDLLEDARQQGALTVYLNPGDLELIEKKAGLALQADEKQFILKADRDLERGGCRVESPIQLIEASVSGMFEKLEKEIDATRSRQSAVKPPEP